jgi:hypothetical protein
MFKYFAFLFSVYVPFIVAGSKNASRFVINNEIYTINTRLNLTNLHLPSINLSKYKRGAYCMGVEIFNHLPWDKRVLLYDLNKFKLVTNNLFLREPFYLIEEYLEWSDKRKEDFNKLFHVFHIIHYTLC